MKTLKQQLNLGFTTLHFYENYVVSTIEEGVCLEEEDVKKIEIVTGKYYKNCFFGYLINRQNHYSINPLIYLNVSKIQKLVGIAMIYNTDLKKMNAMFERKFFNKPFQVFNELESAEIWLNNLVEQKKLVCQNK